MTINRCIDYTKASKGLKLVPRYETIDLYDALLLPLSCMQNIQNRIEIVLHMPKLTYYHPNRSQNTSMQEICTHVITDKQWLQENVLCLLSNAVKYSSDGVVDVRVSLTLSLEGYDNRPIGVESDGGSKRMLPRPYPSSKSLRRAGGSSTKSNTVSPTTGTGSGGTVGNVMSGTHIQSPTGTGSGEVQWLLFEVEDHGIGMSEEAMQSLFSPFKQTQRLAGGTGLGLYSLAKRVEALRGKYGVRHRRDGSRRGSLFWFAFPYQPDTITASMCAPHIMESDGIKVDSIGNLNHMLKNNILVYLA